MKWRAMYNKSIEGSKKARADRVSEKLSKDSISRPKKISYSFSLTLCGVKKIEPSQETRVRGPLTGMLDLTDQQSALLTVCVELKVLYS